MVGLSTYVGEKKALVFPVMCDGYIQIDYSAEIAEEDYGIFGHDDSVTIEAILTPYDINGLGYKFADTNNPAGTHGVVNSVKTIPAVQAFGTTPTNHQSHLYRNQTSRVTDKMMIFHNDSLELYLENSTSTNQNQPAEYKIGFKVRNGATVDTLTTTAAQFSSVVNQYITNSAYPYYGPSDTTQFIAAAANVNTHTPGTDNFEMTGANDSDNYFYVGQELFTVSGQTFTSIGTVTAVESSGKTVTLSAAVAADLTGQSLFTHNNREAPYLLSSAHVAASYDVTNGRMSIYYNGDVVAEKIHTNHGTGTFAIEPEDSYIGQDPSVGSSTQFMGELHEFAILKGTKTEYSSIHTLAPNYRNVLLYYRFEEVDL